MQGKMADVRLLIREEGRTARNLVAFNVPVGTNTTEKVTKKPPSVPRVLHSNSTKQTMQKMTRVRSASTGRDKKSELQARYWAFLFGNLQRAVDGIYQTCEEDENISECKEVILVLENYTRDFHNLIEWFKVKWAYENSPPPLRRTPLAWEVRKTSPCRMWNSNVIPKSSSPLQRMSPTESVCRSPTDFMPFENKSVLVEKINRAKEESVHKIAKDNRNYISKDNSNNSKEKKKRETDKANNPVTGEKSAISKAINKSSLKHTVSVKSNVSSVLSNKITDTNIYETRNKLNIKNNSKQVKNCQQGTNSKKLKEASTDNPYNKTNNIENVKDIEAVKNEINAKVSQQSKKENTEKNSSIKIKKQLNIVINDSTENRTISRSLSTASAINISKSSNVVSTSHSYSAVSRSRSSRVHERTPVEAPKFIRSKTTLCDKKVLNVNKTRPGTSVIVRRPFQPLDNEKSEENILKKDYNKDINGSVEVLTKQTIRTREDDDGWQTVKSRYRRGSSHNLNMSTRFHKPSTATSLPALSIDSPPEKSKKNCFTPDGNQKPKKKILGGKTGKNINNEVEKVIGQATLGVTMKNEYDDYLKNAPNLSETNSTSVIAAIFKNDAELLEKRIQQFMAAQAERERIILEEERKTEEADSQRSQQLSDEEAFLKKQILELESTDIDVDTETDETDGEMVLEIEDESVEPLNVAPDDDISLEDRYENMLEGMSWSERVDTLAQLQALVARHPGRALELHQKLSSPSRKRSLPETLRRYQAKQACAQHKRQKLLMEKSQRLRELLNKVEDVKSAKSQLIEDKRVRMEMKLKRAEENRTQHLLEIVRKAHDEDSKLKEIAFINELEAQNKRHDFMALCQEQEERLQGIQEERQRRQEEKAAKEAAAEERRKLLEAERQLRIQKMKQARREREERVGKMQLEREKERQELAREKARDREERLSALHAAQLANQEELQKKIAQKQQESARRHVENIEHIRQRAVESSILRSEEVPPTLKSYPAPKQCSLCSVLIPNEVQLLSHLKGKQHLEAVRNAHDGREPSRDELQRFNISQICDVTSSNDTIDNKAAKEKQKALKRRCRKIKQRMALRGQEWEESQKDETCTIESANKTKFRRNLKEIDRLYSNHLKTAWTNIAVTALERRLGEITRNFIKTCSNDQDVFRSLNGFDTFTNLFNLGLNTQNTCCNLPNKSIISLCKAYKASINGHSGNIETILMGNKNLAIVDLLLQRLEALTSLDDQSQVLESTGNSTGCGTVATGAIQLLCSLIPEEPFEKSTLSSRIQDIAAYLVAGGLVDRMYRHTRALIETDFFLDQERESPLTVASFELLARICRHLKRSINQESGGGNHGEAGNGEQTTVESHLLTSLTVSEAAGAVGALYTAIALPPQSQKGSSPTPNQASLSANAKTLAAKGLALLRSIAELDLNRLQTLLAAEGTNLQWRLLASHLISRLSRDPLPTKLEIGPPSTTSSSNVQILAELFTVLGYFAINNPENQLILQSAGAGPSVLQQLCTLPFPFYGDPTLSSYTIPALLAATHKNSEAIAILSCELSYQLLEEFKKSEEGKLNPLVRLLKDTPSPPHSDPSSKEV